MICELFDGGWGTRTLMVVFVQFDRNHSDSYLKIELQSALPLLQATLALAMDILLSEENGRVDLQQGVGRLINAIVEVLGPELAPGSIFFSRCKV